jgi:PAS domain S-box-containing protein
MAEPIIKILLVEDNPGDARLLQEHLADVTSVQFELTHAEQLQYSLQLLQQTTFDVILLDLSLPDSSGLDTLAQVRDYAPTLPILVLTGLDDERLAVRAVQKGAQDYCIKGQITGDLMSRAIRYAIERKRAQEELRQQRDFLDAVVETASEGIAVSTEDGNFIIYNSQLQEITGYSQDEAQQPDFLSRLYPDPSQAAQVRTTIQRAFEGQELRNQEWEITRKDGKPRRILMSARVLAYNNRSWLLSTVRDISDRRQAEQKIREQAALIDIATDAILVQDLSSHILFWSRGAERLYGWTSEQAVGQNADRLFQQHLSPDDIDVQPIVLNRGQWQGELQHKTRNGQEIVVESRWTLMPDQAGKPRSILVVNTDITQRKQLEAQFLRAQRMESLGILASGIAHDLNNVMTPILAVSQLLQMKLTDEKSQQLLTMQEDNIKRGASLIRQVLSFARGLDGKFTVLQIGHVIAEIRQIVVQTFPKSIHVQLSIANDLWMVRADPSQLHQVLINLCVNARDAMLSGGTLVIGAENTIIDQSYSSIHLDAKPGNYVMIRVADTGTGIPSTILDRIFEPFFTTKEVGKGTGLGLSTAVGIIRSHNGFIHVYSEMGRGTEFRVYLPATIVPPIETASGNGLSVSKHGDGELVLIVDDEAAVCEVTQTLLETHGYQVMTAHDGIEAIALYTRHFHEIDVIVIDMMMPNADGPTTIRRLHAINPEVKVIAISGLASNRSLAEESGIGVQAFLSKPYSTQILLDTLQQILVPS